MTPVFVCLPRLGCSAIDITGLFRVVRELLLSVCVMRLFVETQSEYLRVRGRTLLYSVDTRCVWDSKPTLLLRVFASACLFGGSQLSTQCLALPLVVSMHASGACSGADDRRVLWVCEVAGSAHAMNHRYSCFDGLPV